MKEIVGLYSKTWRTWQVDRGDEVPLGKLMSVLQPEMQLTLRKVSSVLMGSATDASQIDLDVAVEGRNKQYGVQYAEKAKPRAEMKLRGFTRVSTFAHVDSRCQTNGRFRRRLVMEALDRRWTSARCRGVGRSIRRFQPRAKISGSMLEQRYQPVKQLLDRSFLMYRLLGYSPHRPLYLTSQKLRDLHVQKTRMVECTVDATRTL